ncbi:Protein argonaute [Neolecta irregularis DAH-3]|uniref:Protein argonaute n=1 Tax=Neolecta irregularis (strain DAH-3) TaxID=1198029 RepID=A0A1U7LLR0_NEOID|nr:Protein argonaute [Neolecta irregularis DAH-3]|eukprot:OLL23587.1 Protein argonaute [Neolecta irregularis DAH-3]
MTMDLCSRPSDITEPTGIPALIYTNHYKVNSIPKSTVYQYEVIFGKGSGMLKPAFTRLLWNTRPVQEMVGNHKVIYDGRQIAWSATQLFREKTIEFETTVKDIDLTTALPEQKYTVRMQLTDKINLLLLQEFIQNRLPKNDDIQKCFMVLSNLLRQTPTQKFHILGNSKNFYSQEKSVPLSQGLELWNGIFQSIRPSVVNVDVATAVVWQGSISLLQLVSRYAGVNPEQLATYPRQQRSKLARAFKGLVFFVNHRGEQGLRRRIVFHSFTDAGASEIRFDMKGESITVQNYFLRTYNKRLEYPQVMCCKTSRNDILPLECCIVQSGQRYAGALTQDITSKIIRHAAKPPRERKEMIQNNVQQLDWARDPFLRDYGLEIDRNMMEITGRLIKPPKLQYFNNRPANYKEPGKWDLRGLRFVKAAQLANWAVIVFEREQKINLRAVQDFITTFVSEGTNYGMRFHVPQPNIEHVNPARNITDTIRNVISTSLKKFPKLPFSFVLCIYEQRNIDLYKRIKISCDIELGISSQICLRQHVLKSNLQYIGNVMMKVNKKLGGINWRIDQEDHALSKINASIVLGGDVCHAAPGSLMPSLATLTSSMDRAAANYTGQGRSQGNRIEIIQDLQSMITNAFKIFYHNTGEKPMNILYFRDGVSEGQYSQVKAIELKAIKAACFDLQPDWKPSILICVVTKRHHTRFFPSSSTVADRNGNVRPGLIVSSGITHPVDYDFYVQSHSALKGTARPAHYYVLHDDIGIPPSLFQDLCHNMCYNYERSTTAVSIIPPIYYADLVSRRIRAHLTTDYDAVSTVSGQDPPGDEAAANLLRGLHENLTQVAWYM